jgi:hypothetical protein
MMQTSICADLLLKTIVETQQSKRYSLKDAFAAHGIGMHGISRDFVVHENALHGSQERVCT